MKAGGLLALLIAAALTALTVPAAAHHPREETASSSALAIFGGTSRSARRARPSPRRRRSPAPARTCRSWPTCRSAIGEVPKGANDDDFVNNAADIELAGDYAFIGSYVQGLVIANISSCRDPSKPQLCKPFVQGVLKCSGGQFDVQLSPDARYVVMAHESASANKACHPSEEGAQVIDVSNKSAPREVAFISDKTAAGPGRGRRAQRDARLAAALHRQLHPDLPADRRLQPHHPEQAAQDRRDRLRRATRRTAPRARTTRSPTTAPTARTCSTRLRSRRATSST